MTIEPDIGVRRVAPRFVVLLRGVNVGGARRVPMADFRALLEGLGYSGVRTLLNSGNAVFGSTARSTSAHAARIRKALADGLGVEVPVVVKSAAEMAAIVAANTLADTATDASRLLVAFAGEAAALQALGAVAPLLRETDRWQLGEHAAYLWCPDGILHSPAAAALLGRTGAAVTTRNWATVGKLMALLRQNADEPAPRRPA